jgi:polyisoprenoid-binding protein YceI
VARYVIAPERSFVWIDARSNIHPIHSSTNGLEGFVELDVTADGSIDLSATPAGKLSLAVDRLTSGNRLEDRELHKRIDSRRYPTIDGVIDQVQADGQAGTYQVSGKISFRGVDQHHHDKMQISIVEPGTLQLAGSSRFDIREFGMEPPRMLMLKVEPEVDIRVEIFAVEEA